MTARVVNLRTVRKSRARDEKRDSGHANAAKYGRSKAEREADRLRAEKALRDHDNHKRET